MSTMIEVWTDNPTGVLWAACLLVAGCYLLRAALLDGPFSGFPYVNSKKSWEIGNILAQKRFQRHGSTYLKAGFSQGSIFGVVTDLGPKLVLSGQFIDEFKDEHVLDHYRAMSEDFIAEVPGFESMFLGNLHNTILRDVVSIITREFERLMLPMSHEVSLTLQDTWSDSPDWHEITLFPSMVGLIARLSSLIFVGEPLCRNPEWLRTVINFTLVRQNAVQTLHLCPAILRPVLHWFLSPCQKLRHEICKARKMTGSALEQLRAGENSSSQDDRKFSSLAWVEEFVAGTKYDAAMIQLRLANAAIHSSTDLLVKVLINLCDHPDLVQDLREEAIESLKKHGCRSLALNQMKLLDSVLKESQRLDPVTTGIFSRYTRQDITLANGTQIAKETPLMIINDVARDPTVYDNPDSFDGYRFLKMREGPDRSRAPFTTTGQNHLGFGYGKYACPGRFFAANEIKLALCHIFLKYDWRIVSNSPHDVHTTGFISYRDPGAKLEVRRRVDSPDLEFLTALK